MKLVIEADGGSRGNPGVAGSGTVVYSDNKAEVLREIAYVVGTKATNNVAEYRGLLEGLKAARELGATSVEVFMDSKLVVEQMSGRWKIKHPDMKVLAIEAREIASGIESVSYNWIPREKNKRADALSNVAMDAAAAGKPVGIVGDFDSDSSDSGADPVKEDLNCTETKPTNWNGATSDPTRFLLLRHGQTAMSAARLYSGRSNPALSELGEKQAAAAARRLAQTGGIDAIVSSPLTRTLQTAEAAASALGIKVRVIDDLIETDFGLWDGKTFSEAHEQDPQLHTKWLSDSSVAPPGGESLQAVNRRVKKARESLQHEYGAANVLVVSHVTPIKAIMRQALDAGPSFFQKAHLDLASLSIAEFYEDGPTCVRLFNDTSHLEA
ncbi:bifunctional RNase H/acid phosphatase [Corynebacterium glutamicum]|uniref:bifunctional RNase H/acid phosphatase n=1 Tax=Corynebacterium glutamicum TaxID=1718 RepID=UPI00058A5E23|nr:bifunctional RNase H/acid phosphatase [Corynebacterium glutamicum]AJE67903.1 acid phosphatase [Corynebacterium glutamicum]OKX96185.1 bifunctional RNase H/acid phosphatase [Corynebacterium glutamicum]TWS37441.1 acid phosphatase [Corynebacterium glutamicum]